MSALHPPAPQPLPLPRADAPPLPLIVAVSTVMSGGHGNRPCEHLARPVVERLREQHLFSALQDAWATPRTPDQLRCTFDCSVDDHPTLTLYATMLVGGTLFLASPLPLFNVDYDATARADVLRDGQLLKTYQVATHVNGDYNYWAALRTDPTTAVIQEGEEDVVAKLVTAIVNDRAFWEQLAGVSP